MNWPKIIRNSLLTFFGISALAILSGIWLWYADDQYVSKYILRLVASIGEVTDLKTKYKNQRLCDAHVVKSACYKQFVDELGGFKNSTQALIAQVHLFEFCADFKTLNRTTETKKCFHDSIEIFLQKIEFAHIFEPKVRAPSSATSRELRRMEKYFYRLLLSKMRTTFENIYKSEKDLSIKAKLYSNVLQIDAKIRELDSR